MKIILSILLMFAMGSVFAQDSDFVTAVKSAHALKAKGDYAGAAQTSPQSLCRAMYHVHAAWLLIGKLNKNNDFVYDESKSGNNDVAISQLDAAQNDLDNPDKLGCTGVEASIVKQFIDKTRAQILAHSENK